MLLVADGSGGHGVGEGGGWVLWCTTTASGSSRYRSLVEAKGVGINVRDRNAIARAPVHRRYVYTHTNEHLETANNLSLLACTVPSIHRIPSNPAILRFAAREGREGELSKLASAGRRARRHCWREIDFGNSFF